jgi:hypothetical protein
MLRGWKSASCKGFPKLSRAAGGVSGALGSLLATKNIPMLSSQLLRPIPLMNPPISLDRAAADFFSAFGFFYIVYFCLSKWDKFLAPAFHPKSY